MCNSSWVIKAIVRNYRVLLWFDLQWEIVCSFWKVKIYVLPMSNLKKSALRVSVGTSVTFFFSRCVKKTQTEEFFF